MAKYAEFVVNINNGVSSNTASVQKLKRTKQTKTIQKSKFNGKKALNIANMYASRTAQLINSKVGAYTGNKVATANRNETIMLASMAITALTNPLYGIGSFAIHALNNSIDFAVRMKNSQEESDYKRSYLGNMATSKSRWKGSLR